MIGILDKIMDYYRSLEFWHVDALNSLKVVEFLKSVYGENYYGADLKFFDWYYKRNPCKWYKKTFDQNLLPIHALVDTDGCIKSLHMYSPFDLNAFGTFYKGCFDEEWISIAETRGAGRFLAQYLLKNVDVYCGFGCNDLSEVAFKKLGVQFFEITPRLVSIIDKKSMLELISGLSGEVKPFNYINETSLPKTNYKTLSIDNVCEVYSQNMLHNKFLTINKDLDWLIWRYKEHPYIKYIFVGEANLPCSSFSVVRVESYENVYFVRIVDVFGTVEQFPKLYKAVLAYAGSIGAVMVDYFNTSEALIDFIFTEVQGTYKNLDVPYRLQPPVLDVRPSFNHILKSNIAKPVDLFAFSKGDSTQDIFREGFQSPVMYRS